MENIELAQITMQDFDMNQRAAAMEEEKAAEMELVNNAIRDRVANLLMKQGN